MGDIWEDKMLELFDSKIKNYSIQQIENINGFYLKNLLLRIKSESFIDDEDLLGKIEVIINELPEKVEGKLLKYTNKNLNEITNLKTIVRKKHNYVPSGYYKRASMLWGTAIGVSIGTTIGAAFKITGLPALGIPFGISIGLILGGYLDRKAEKENRVI